MTQRDTWGLLPTGNANPWNDVDGPAGQRAAVLPRITVITPSYNQAAFLEATIRSVLAQGYPNLEYFVIDGGSTDGSRAVLERYSPWIDYWVSERDQGQTDAILKGLQRATGEWFNWINSDDILAPGALWEIARAALANPDTQAIAGDVQDFHLYRPERLLKPTKLDAAHLMAEPMSGTVFHQPGIWVRREQAQALGMNRQWAYRFDFDFYVRYLHHHPRLVVLDRTLAYFRFHDSSKTVSQLQRFHTERLQILEHMAIDPAMTPLQALAGLTLRRWQWFDQLDSWVEDRSQSRWRRAAAILRGIWQDREARWGRHTFKALRRILLRGGRRTGSGFLGGRVT
jgi:glycosyltransferase involved in cell wall biosynthesis